MDVPTDPGATAAEAARRAAERAEAARHWRRALSHRDDRSSVEQSRGFPTSNDARQRQEAARERLRAALHRSADAHDRAAEQHEAAARSGGATEAEHRRKAETHRADAVINRRRAEALDTPDEPPEQAVGPERRGPGAAAGVARRAAGLRPAPLG
ncbi:hypothetical protein [Amycolatopsis tolypomycina]|uniref:hypothetical protein n=1 Tax=Amycolatopsis tolypomycina TaxID=208445 RepID=UPI000B88C0EB|nr:hypothetical protein [Amycolatopsis tolypomycina]